ncbi:MAG: glycosyltransferase family 2 protein [Candidatus Dormibacteria bacterium]
MSSDKTLTLALVVLTYQGAPFLERLLPSILAQTYDSYEIVVVDNASTDGTIDCIARTLGTRAQVVANTTNLGCATGYNLGAAACPNADVICFLNQDIVLHADYCDAIARRFRDEPRTAAVQPLVMCLDKPQLVENCGHTTDAWLTTRTIGHMEAYGEFAIPRGLMFTLTAPAIRRTWFDRLGGFDDCLFIYYEDTDLSLRIWEAGGRVVFDPLAVVEHVQEGSSRAFPDKWRAYLWTRNRLRLLWKHADSRGGYARAIIATLGAVAIVPALLLRHPRKGVAVGVARGVAWNVLRWKATRGAHRQMQAGTRRSMDELAAAGVLRASEGVLPALRRVLSG